MADFGERLTSAIAAHGSLCLGIDPHPFLLEQWGLPDSAEGARQFGLAAIEASRTSVGIVKPQVAFFERFGSEGYRALEGVIASARAAGMLVIADAKRGDVGSTVAAYGAAWLRPGSSLESDAVTVSAYQGVGSLTDVIDLAGENGKGVFLLAATSNPHSGDVQSARLERGFRIGRSVASSIVAEAADLNAGRTALGSVGVVIGATVGASGFGIDIRDLVNTPILGPGFGEQGARIQDLRALYGVAADRVIVSMSRSVLRFGPDDMGTELRRLTTDIESALAG